MSCSRHHLTGYLSPSKVTISHVVIGLVTNGDAFGCIFSLYTPSRVSLIKVTSPFVTTSPGFVFSARGAL